MLKTKSQVQPFVLRMSALKLHFAPDIWAVGMIIGSSYCNDCHIAIGPKAAHLLQPGSYVIAEGCFEETVLQNEPQKTEI